MAGLDLQEVLKTGMALSNLQETRRRNDIYEQNALTNMMRMELDQQQLQVQKQKMQHDAAMKGLSSIEQMMSDPMISVDTGRRLQLRVAQGHILRTMGVKDFPLPDNVEDLMGGAAEYERLVQSFIKGDDNERNEAAMRFAVAFPEQGKKMLDELSAVVELPDKLKNLQETITLKREQIDQLKLKNSKLQMMKNAYDNQLPQFERILGLRKSPEFAPHVQKMHGMSREAKAAYLKANPDFQASFEAAMAEEAAPAKTNYEYVVKQVAKRNETRDRMFKETGEAPQWLNWETGAYSRIGDAYRLVANLMPGAQWEVEKVDAEGRSPWEVSRLGQAKESDPLRVYDEDRWKALTQYVHEMRLLHDTTSKDLAAISDERLNLANRRFDAGQTAKLADTYAYGKYIEALDKKGDAGAIQHALAEAEKKYPGAPVDPKIFKNPEKVGKLSVDVSQPTTAFRTQAQNSLTGVQSTLHVIQNLKSVLSQENIGLSAAIKSTAYGFTSQIKGMAEIVGAEALASQLKNKNFSPSKWFDPNVSTVDLLANTLAYRLINQEQGGRISDKDMLEMKKRLNISTWMAGKEDVLQRLSTIEDQLRFEEGVYRRVMPDFLKEQPGAATGSGEAAGTAEEYLKSIGIEP